ncbi:MAG: family 78 glycoside hydrolase catalytic domain, partial [Lachnospiraceae bacterium]|nr:family 78 glycoside hydrolase catalytic domain [Lachnospiraceae bacterium]
MRLNIYCEYMKDPVGLDMEKPRFSWMLESEAPNKTIGAEEDEKAFADRKRSGRKGAVEHIQKGEHQLSYHILVNKEISFGKRTCVWDSGVVDSDETLNVVFDGDKLETATDYYYKVTIVTSGGRTLESDTGHFLTGLMPGEKWEAGWIGGPMMEEDTFWFRNSFTLDRAVNKAVAFIGSPNYYILTVNGSDTTDTVLNNAWTDCNKTFLYGTYDITNLLQTGNNAFGVEIGNGWNAMEMGFQGYGLGEHLFSMQVLLTYEDGTKEWRCTNNNEWYFTVEGPMRANSIYQGEDYDARMELTGWNTPEYDMTCAGPAWKDAVEFEPMKGEPRAQILEPIRVVEERRAKAVHLLEDGSYVFDMGQNFAGWVRLQAEAAAGTRISLIYSELEKEDHSLNRISLRGVRATDNYICKGEGTEIYEPRFTYHGFRYVQVKGLPYPPKEDTIVGCVVRSAVEKIGEFQCSSDLINQLQQNIQWTEASNLHGLPTDCPQRDERLGWLNDMTVRNECALYSYRLPNMYDKWLQDVRDAQGEESGAVTDTAPFRRFGQRPADPVSSSFLLIPWNVYCHYGDTRIIEKNYEAMKKWIGYLFRNSRDYVMKYSPMGDWAAPIGGTNLDSIGGGAVSTITPTQLMGTGYLYYDCELMIKMAEVMKKPEDALFY